MIQVSRQTWFVADGYKGGLVEAAEAVLYGSFLFQKSLAVVIRKPVVLQQDMKL